MAGALQRVAERMLAEREDSRRIVEAREAAGTATATDALGFPEFAAHCPIKTKGEGIIMLDPAVWFEEQRRFNAERTGRDLILKARQVGITTFELMRGLSQSGTRPSWNTQIVGHERDLCLDLFEHIRFAADHLTLEGRLPAMTQDTLRQLRFEGLGSKIGVTEAGATERSASKKGHSGTIHRLHCTEVSHWNEPEATLTGLLGAVPANGEVLIESTANGVSGYFHQTVMECRDGHGPYRLHFFPWFEHAAYRETLPRDFDAKPQDKIEELLRSLGCDDEQIQWWRGTVKVLWLDTALEQYPPSIELAFRSTGDKYVPQETLDALASKVRPPSRIMPVTFEGRDFGDLLVYAEPAARREYVAGADVCEGIGKDAHAVHVLDRRTAETAATFWSDSIEPGDLGTVLAVVGKHYNGALVAPERNNNGHATVRALTSERKYPKVYAATDGRPGWVTSGVTRPIMFDDLLRGCREGAYWTPDAGTHSELTTLVKGAGGKPQARGKGTRGGSLDDRVVAWAIALQIRAAPVDDDAVGPIMDGLGQRSAWGT